MKKVFHPANERGHADHGWLNAWHSFSFASWYDPAKVHFGMLRVLNDDTVAPGMGFGKHPHDNMEIVTIPLAGVLEHADSTGNREQLRPGEIQIMSAGTGIYHSEYNASEEEYVKLLQIWVMPKLRGIKPRYDQKKFDDAGKKDKFQLLVSPDSQDESLSLNQDTWFSIADFTEEKTIDYKLHSKDNGIYAFVIEGEVETEGQKLGKRDALGLSELDSASFTGKPGSRLLVIEVPMR